MKVNSTAFVGYPPTYAPVPPVTLVNVELQTFILQVSQSTPLYVWSSTLTKVTGGTGAYVGGYPTNAVELTFIHSAWLPSIPSSSAKWIWVTNPVLAADTANGAEYTFQKKFN